MVRLIQIKTRLTKKREPHTVSAQLLAPSTHSFKKSMESGGKVATTVTYHTHNFTWHRLRSWKTPIFLKLISQMLLNNRWPAGKMITAHQEL